MKRYRILIIGLLACTCMAGQERRETVTITVGTNVAATVTNFVSGVVGKIDEIVLDVIGTGTTGNVAVAAIPELTTLSARTLYSNAAIAADATAIPRVQCTDTAGSGISGVYDRFVLFNEAIRIIWANGGTSTGTVAKIVIKYEKEQ